MRRPQAGHGRGRRSLVGALLAAALLAGCGGTAQATRQAAAPAEAPVASAAPEDPRTTVGGVELVVTGFHLFPVPEGDPAAAQLAAQDGVPLTEVAQMHLVLLLRNGADRPSSVAADGLRLGLGARTVDAVTNDVFPTAPLQPGEQAETAVGFDVVARAGTGPLSLQWTHDGQVVVLPIGTARQAT